MSDQESANAAEDDAAGAPPDEGLDDLQESQLDSVTGGGGVHQPLMDLQDAEPDKIEHSDDRPERVGDNDGPVRRPDKD